MIALWRLQKKFSNNDIDAQQRKFANNHIDAQQTKFSNNHADALMQCARASPRCLMFDV